MNANATINRTNIDISADARDRLESAVEYVRKQYPDMGLRRWSRSTSTLRGSSRSETHGGATVPPKPFNSFQRGVGNG